MSREGARLRRRLLRGGMGSCIGLAALLSGCAQVQPWERGNLAKPQMQLDAQATRRALLDHVHASREGATVGTSAQGGGCGCY